MAENKLLDLSVFPFEPHSLRSGKGHKLEVKQRLRERILHAIQDEGISIDTLRASFRGLLLSVKVEFFLFKGSAEVTNTRFKKDLDNLLKPVLDVMQVSLNSTTKEDLGLGLVEGDEYVCEIAAKKTLVHSTDEEGLHIVVFERDDPDMLRALTEHMK